MLPDNFDWPQYEQLIELTDRAAWAYLFAIRDKESDIALNEIGYHRRINTDDVLKKIPRLNWRDGVCFSGMKGHGVHSELQDREDWYAKDAEFISLDECQLRQKNNQFKKGTIITTASKDGINGHYVFPNQDAFDAYDKVRRALGGRTIELAINICMPKKDLLKEIDKIISEQQESFGGSFHRKRLARQTILQWARGLACWDLKVQREYTSYRIAKELAPLWRTGDSQALDNEPALDEDKKQVATAIKSVSPMISGGWRVLCGDPVATLGSDLIDLEYHRR